MLLISKIMNKSKPRMKSKFNKYLLSFCLILICTTVSAQKKSPPAPAPKQNDGQPGLPIDGGLSFLLISGVAYGIYELRKKK